MGLYSKNKSRQGADTVPFESATEAWFWFIAAQEAKDSGARIIAGSGLFPRPCEPVDILKAVDRLYRKRRLLRDHLLVLRHYGRRHISPDPRRRKEARAYILWEEALDRIEDVLVAKKIVQRDIHQPCTGWHNDAHVMMGDA